ncbi:MAG: ribose 5-phosphate isomerase B [Lachnospiraceae bacterium]
MIAIGSDHGGLELKRAVMKHLEQQNIEVKDFGCYSEESCDYPDYGKQVANAVADGLCKTGIVICTTGIGISIVANRVPGIRAALCLDPYMAKMTRLHNDANVLALGEALVGKNMAFEIVDTFLSVEFSGEEKHKRRIKKIESNEV